MTKPVKLKRTQVRHYSAHHMLIEVARRANENAGRSEPGWSYEATTVIVFSALGIEALMNAFGERKVPDWDDYESARPVAKMRIVCQALGLPFDANAEPWKTAKWLFKIRNLVAHAKPQLIREEIVVTQEELDRRLFDRPSSKLEAEITVVNAAKAYRAALNVKDALCGCLEPAEAHGLSSDGWTGFTKLHEPREVAVDSRPEKLTFCTKE